MKRSRRIKFSLILIITVVLSLPGVGQSAAEYFLPVSGSTWTYQRFDLDTANRIISSSKRLVTDTLTGTRLFGVVNGYVLRSLDSPLRDSTIVSPQGDQIWFYNGGYPVEGLARAADSLGLGFIPQAPGWYSYLQFSTPPANNKVDTLFRRDSTVVIDSTEFPLTLIISRIRRPAGVVTVPAGTFINAVPFEITLNVDTWIFTPLGKFAVPLLKLTDTLFVAKNTWIVKEVQGSTYFPLTKIDNDSVPNFRIPGYIRLLEQQRIAAVEPELSLPRTVHIGQNFPNPFNGTTTVTVTVTETTPLSVEIFDLLGRSAGTIVSERVEPGTHRFRWDAGNFPSGMYLYRITAGTTTTTKKMILQK